MSSVRSMSCDAAPHRRRVESGTLDAGPRPLWRDLSRRLRHYASSTRACCWPNVEVVSSACAAQLGRTTPPCGTTTAVRCVAASAYALLVQRSSRSHGSRHVNPLFMPPRWQASYKLHEAHSEMRTHLRADIGPLPRYPTRMEYDKHLKRALVVHVTALSKSWRQRDLRRFGVMDAIARHVISSANLSAREMTAGQRNCLERVAAQMAAKWPAAARVTA